MSSFSLIYKVYHKYIFHLNKLRIFKLKLLGATVGKNVQSYGRFTVVNYPNLFIANNIKINEGVHLNCRDKIYIGNNVHLSSFAQLHTGKLHTKAEFRTHTQAPIFIEDNVWIASSVIVLAGVKIGRNAVIAAGSVVTKDIPENCLAAGMPARIIKNI